MALINTDYHFFSGFLPCSVCGCLPSGPHHWQGKRDTQSNILALCKKHHDEVHKIGRNRFWLKYGNTIVRSRERIGLPPLRRYSFTGSD